MRKFLFVFGYETPIQHRNNKEHGWDDEDSQSVFIEATDADEALAWGREIAEQFVKDLWRSETGPSWKEGEFAHWFRTADEELARAREAGVPCVRVGEHPRF